jgi:glycosyltransferase involved in cell wall biosynthesis
MRLAYVVGCYPEPSETFIAREIAGLRARGHAVAVYSLFAPATPEDGVVYGWPTPAARLARKVQGVGPLARRWGRQWRADGVERVVAHFGSLPSTVALAAAGDLPFVLSLHARDLYVEAERLPDKLARAAVTVTCTQANVDYLRALAPAAPVRLVYHGLPPAWLDAPLPARPRPADAPLRVLAAGRLVEKKGFRTLLEVAALMDDVELRLYGDGPLRPALLRHAVRLGLPNALMGWADGDVMREAYAWADVFCCPSIIAHDGDRDGLPNVLVEAMSTGLPCVGSAFSGIPEAIDDGVIGLLVPPGDAAALAAALARLRDPALRATLGAAAARRVHTHFNGARWLDVLEGVLEEASG